MKKKILIIASWGDSLINFRGPLIDTLINRGHDVVTCAPEISSRMLQELHRRGVDFHYIKLDRTGANPIKDFLALISIYQLVKEVRPDLTLAYTAKPVIYGSLASKLAGLKDIYAIITGLGSTFINDNAVNNLVRPVLKGLYSVALRCNRVVFFQNKDDLREFRQNLHLHRRQRIAVINGSGVDLDHYYPQPVPDQLSFLLAARLIADKGILDYVKAARLLKPKYPAVKFYLAGWIDETPSAISEEMLVEWQQEGNIEYLGNLKDIRTALKIASVFVLPSMREGTPHSVLEAMSTGRPIITTDTPGCRETVREQVNGFLVPANNHLALCSKMETFIQSPQLVASMGRESRQLAKAKFDVHSVNHHLLNEMQL